MQKDALKTQGSTPADQLTQKELLHFYEQMLLIRRFEERCTQLYGMGLIGGFCHLYIGQEAVVVGLQASLTPTDSVITAYRDHGHMLACDMDPKGVMAELTGRSGGYSKGKGGSMHMFSKEKNFYGGHGIVGAQISLGTGLGFAHKYKNDGGLCMAYMGDGASNQGQVYESFNMAALWKLPVIYIIENNQYGMGTSVERHAAKAQLHTRGEPYGIPGYVVNGMNVLDVYNAGRMATEYVRAGNGPILLEVQTYRYRGHSMSDPAKYRSKEEVDEMRTHHDPLDHLRDLLINKFKATEASFEELDSRTTAVVKEAVTFAETSPEPDPAELWTDVLKDEVIRPRTASDSASASPAAAAPSQNNSTINW